MAVTRAFVTFILMVLTPNTWAETAYPKVIKKGLPITMEAYEHYMSDSPHYVNREHLPKIQNHPDGSKEIIFSPEYSLTLGTKTILRKNIEIPGQISEITCLPLDLRTRCLAKTDLLIKDYRLIWKSHPNPEKIGRAAKVRIADTNTTGESSSTQTFIASYEGQFQRFPPPSTITDDEWKGLSPSRLHCDSIDWYEQLGKMFSLNSTDLRLNEWSQENMDNNPETSQAENRTAGAHLGVHLTKTSEGIEIKNIEFPKVMESQGLFLFLGDVTGWNLVKGPQICDLSLNFDTTSFLAQFSVAEAELEKEPFNVVYFKDNREWTLLTVNNRPIEMTIDSYLGSDSEFKMLARLGLVDSELARDEVSVAVIMADGSHQDLPLKVYTIKLMEPVQ